MKIKEYISKRILGAVGFLTVLVGFVLDLIEKFEADANLAGVILGASVALLGIDTYRHVKELK